MEATNLTVECIKLWNRVLGIEHPHPHFLSSATVLAEGQMSSDQGAFTANDRGRVYTLLVRVYSMRGPSTPQQGEVGNFSLRRTAVWK